MPSGVIQLLRWGGVTLGIIFVIALIVAEPSEGDGSAPTTLYWILIIIGAIAAIVGFTRRGR